MGRRHINDGYEADWTVGRTEVGGDAVFYIDASVDGQGGHLRKKPVFTAQEAADYLNRGDGLVNGLETGAIWRGALDAMVNGRASFEDGYGTAKPYDYVGGALTHLNFGFYDTVDDIDVAYDYIPSNTQQGKLRLDGFSAFSEAQRVAARQAIASWDELVAISFVETDSAQADINFMNTTTGPIQASAYLPWDYGSDTINGQFVDWNRVAGDVAVNPLQATNGQFDEGQYGLTTLIHELGHSLGLEHPGSYNFGPGFEVIYDNGAEYYQDSHQYTIMSYWDAEETGAHHVDWEFLTYRYSATPNVHDILAIQQMYGADTTTRAGNDVYGFNMSLSTTGKTDDAFNFIETPKPVVTIWDAGGEDTLDLSGFDTPSIIDLNPGAFSSAGGYLSATIPSLAEINANRAEIGLAARTQATYDLYVELFKASYTDGLMRDNISIAYNVIIENATGGGGNDTITGNSVGNVLLGNGGNDVLSGKGGNDTLNGGLGIDDLRGGEGADKFVFDNLSKDKIRDFDSGTDKIDLSHFDITSANVKVTKDSVFADTDGNGTYDLHIVVNGESAQMSDIFFG